MSRMLRDFYKHFQWLPLTVGSSMQHERNMEGRSRIISARVGIRAATPPTLESGNYGIVECFGISPRLAITSPEKGCGKTTLLDVLSRLVWRPLSTANVNRARSRPIRTPAVRAEKKAPDVPGL